MLSFQNQQRGIFVSWHPMDKSNIEVKMLDKTLLNFISQESKRLIKYFGKNTDARTRSLARLAKVTEELGELSNEVLAIDGDQRSSKLLGNHQEKAAEEIADVIITVLLLAENLDVDADKALKKKIKKIKNRRY